MEADARTRRLIARVSDDVILAEVKRRGYYVVGPGKGNHKLSPMQKEQIRKDLHARKFEDLRSFAKHYGISDEYVRQIALAERITYYTMRVRAKRALERKRKLAIERRTNRLAKREKKARALAKLWNDTTLTVEQISKLTGRPFPHQAVAYYRRSYPKLFIMRGPGGRRRK